MRTVGLLGNTKDRSLIFVTSKPEMVERLKEDRVIFIWKKVARWRLVVGRYLPPRGKNLELEMRLIHDRYSTVNQLKVKKEIEQLHGISSSLEKEQVFDLQLDLFSFSCCFYIYLWYLVTLGMSLKFYSIELRFYSCGSNVFYSNSLK